MSRLLLALCLLAALPAPPAHADGCLLPKAAAADITEPEQKAVVVFDAGREDLILQVRYSGNPAEFGWLVPLPALPTVAVASANTFEWLSRGTQKPQLAASDRVARVLDGRRRSIAMRSAGVEVLRRDTLGVYDTVTLAADRGDALQSWLKEHDFRAPAGAGPVLDAYARRRCNEGRTPHPVVQFFGTSMNVFTFSNMNNPGINMQADTVARTGAFAGCESPWGVFDMVGNLHEWIADPNGTFKGGFYVDAVRNGPGCLYTTTAHAFSYRDYSTGFRCCADPSRAP